MIQWISDGTTWSIFYQKSVRNLFQLNRTQYQNFMSSNGLVAKSLLPDLVIVGGSGRVLAVEVKYSGAGGPGDVATGVVEMMAYLADTPELWEQQKGPCGIVVASGICGVPDLECEIVACNEDQVGSVFSKLRQELELQPI